MKLGRVHIKPFVSAGEILVHGDGRTWEVVPLSVFDAGSMTVVRVGRTTYWFDGEDGKYDGSEFNLSGADLADLGNFREQMGRVRDNRGRAPAEAYFDPSRDHYRYEVALWPKDSSKVGPVPVPTVVAPAGVTTRLCDCGWMLPRVVEASQGSVEVKVECPCCGKFWAGSGSTGGAS